MKKLLLALALAIGLAAPATAQYGPGDPPAGYDGGSATNPFLAPNGDTNTTGYGFTTAIDMGLWNSGGGLLTLQSEAAGTGGRGWLELGTATFRLKGDSNFDLTDYVEITHATVGGQVLTLTSTDTTNSDTSRIELTNAYPADVIIFASETGDSSTTTFGTTGTTFNTDSTEILSLTRELSTVTADEVAGSGLVTAGANAATDATSYLIRAQDNFATENVSFTLNATAATQNVIIDVDDGSNDSITTFGDSNTTFTDPLLSANTGYCFTNDTDACLQLLGTNNMRLTTTTSDPEDIIQINTTTITIEAAEDDNADTSTLTLVEGVSARLDVDDDTGTGTNAQVNLNVTSDFLLLEIDDQTDVNQMNMIPGSTTFTQPIITSGENITALTDATATAFAQIAIPQTIGTNFAAGTVDWTVYCDDATNQAQEVGHVDYACHNLAGTESCSFATPVTHSLGDGTASIVAATFDIVAGVDVVDLRINSDCAGVTPTTLNMYWDITEQKYNVVTPQ